MKIDLHLHTTASDGSLSPSEVVRLAKAHDIELIAITDHDTVSGLNEAISEADALSVKIVTGIEFSCVWGKHDIHIVGLGFDPSHPSISKAIGLLDSIRVDRASRIARRLQRCGFGDVWEYMVEKHGTQKLSRPDFARFLVDSGYCKNEKRAFKQYLTYGKPAYVKSDWPAMECVVEWIIQAGGIAVVAHPQHYKMNSGTQKRFFDAFVESGGRAVEVISAGVGRDQINHLNSLCRHYDLMASVGSDFHGTNTPWINFGNLPVLPHGLKPVWEYGLL